MIDAEEIRLDRWTVVFHPEDKTDDNVKQVNSTGKKRQKLSKMKLTNEQFKKTGQSFVCSVLFFAVKLERCKLDSKGMFMENVLQTKRNSQNYSKCYYFGSRLVSDSTPMFCSYLSKRTPRGLFVQTRTIYYLAFI